MKPWCSFHKAIDLHGAGVVSAEDAQRQMVTAAEILKRFAQRPGVILADEVGMGKTYVSLAVAASVALNDRRRRPVVVMIPPGLREKWSTDFDKFRERCLDAATGARLRCASAENGVEFLRRLDDPVADRCQILFLTHGALQRSMSDQWVRLLVIRMALYRRHGTERIKQALSGCLGQLIRGMGRIDRRNDTVWMPLLDSHPTKWMEILEHAGLVEMGAEDVVPKSLSDALERVGTDDVYEAVVSIPQRDSATYGERLQAARERIAEATAKLWNECLQALKLDLPLLILDEAHHLKNGRTRLASLFHSGDSDVDSQSVRAKGSLGGVFERMVFLTATPFQLGHHELCSVIERFDGIDWKCPAAPAVTREACAEELGALRARLDRAQGLALALNEAWGRLSPEDLVAAGVRHADTDSWWQNAQGAAELTGTGRMVVESVAAARVAFGEAEDVLRPWLIRHVRRKVIVNAEGREVDRRTAFHGVGVVSEDPQERSGIVVEGPALLPFLLAARATLCRPEARPVFAEGLASSYEAFLHTRERPDAAIDEDDVGTTDDREKLERAEWYLERLNENLPLKSDRDSLAHPKIAATATRVAEAWKAGEKVVVFCHFVQTGQALRRAISGRIRDTIAAQAGVLLRRSPEDAFRELEDIGQRFFDRDLLARQAIERHVTALLGKRPGVAHHAETVQDVVRRFLRTPAFLVRFFPLNETKRVTAAAIDQAFKQPDSSGLSLSNLLVHFFEHLETQCSTGERKKILDAVSSMQTGEMSDRGLIPGLFPEEPADSESRLMPNVRLVNGGTNPETKRRLMLTFNSPFFPEVLVASAVMAEGVDLHRYCRYVFHHDLCWNPSTLEQRTGRIDRIGAKVETAKRPIHVYTPFLAATQDERQFQVVSDRERWFNIVMGGEYPDDVASTEKQARRMRLASAISEVLTFRLDVYRASYDDVAAPDPVGARFESPT